ncbi:hypothetical protein PAERUG_E5_London_17_VIM_2_12_12_03000 [Pseudomonas aeruginosa]|nr:hypothetical protein PAERUG_E5_London_17_VIM_2_12_12_03000 [Pseudomonas aeruginosa]
MNGAKPPNSITARLYATARPVERTRTGNCSATAVGAGPKKPPIAVHSNSCISSRRPRLGAAATQANSG